VTRLLAFFVIAFVAGSASAQDWATKDVCSVENPEIHNEVFIPPGLDILEKDAKTYRNGTGRFWQITAPNGAVSHIWGTYHSTSPHILRLPEIVQDQIEDARTIAVEIDFIADNRDDFQRSFQYVDYYKDARHAFDNLLPQSDQIAQLSPEISGWVRDRLFSIGWGEDAHLVLSLSGLARLLLSAPCDDFAAGIFPIQDSYIQLLATLAGGTTLSLEKPNDFFADLKNDDKTAEAMIAVYASYLKPRADNRSLSTQIKLYTEGRLGLMMAWDSAFVDATLGSIGIDSLKLTTEYLLDFRNTRFVEKLNNELPKGGVFTAVGAFHLPGDRGIIELLRNKGYDVTRIPLPGEVK